MRIEARGDEPTAQDVVQWCPQKTQSPDTEKPFYLKLIRKVFASECYDLDLENPWRFQSKLHRMFLPHDVMEHRAAICKQLLRQPRLTAGHFFENVVG